MFTKFTEGVIYFRCVNITRSFHGGSANNCDNGIGNARDADGKDRTLGYSTIWILIGKKMYILSVADNSQEILNTFKSPETLAPARIPMPAGKYTEKTEKKSCICPSVTV